MAEVAAAQASQRAAVQPRHPSDEILAALIDLVSSVQLNHGHSARSCTNCTSPMEPNDDMCNACGHRREDDGTLLGTDEAWDVPAGEFPPSPSTAASPTQLAEQPGPLLRAQAPPGSVALSVDTRALGHRSSLPPYPERPERLQAIMARLAESGVSARCTRLAPREATDEELLRVHDQGLIDAVCAVTSSAHPEPAETDAAGQQDSASASRVHSGADGSSRVGGGIGSTAGSATAAGTGLVAVLDPGMLLTERSAEAARVSAAGAMDVAVAVARRAAAAGLALVRPPGSCANADRAAGGSLLNHAALAARAVQASGSAQRVLLVDFDVHFGHGTQAIFDGDDSVLYVSLHLDEAEFYPKDAPGDVSVVGSGAGEGFTVNVAWAEPGVSDGDALAAATHVVLPLAHSFCPDLVVISAGFGGVKEDVQGGGCNLTPAGYAHMTALLQTVAPVVMVLEGGYNLNQTARCVEACARVLLGERAPALPPGAGSVTSPGGWVAIMNALQVHGSGKWPSLRPLSWAGWTDVIRRQQQAMAEARRQQAAAAGQQLEDGSDDDEEFSGSGYW